MTAVPAPDRCVLGDLLRRHAATQPDKVFIRFADGTTWTYADTLAEAQRMANVLAGEGVARGDTVVVWLPNGPDIVRAWFGINLLGAVYVPLNTAFRGAILAHVLDNADAAVGLVHAELLPRLADVPTGRLTRVGIVGGAAPAAGTFDVAAALAAAKGHALPPAPDLAAWNHQSIIYTSGTTGPSKGVVSSYCHLYNLGIGGRPHTSEDRMLVALPLFHSGGMGSVYGMLVRGGSIALADTFRTSTFWPLVRETEATMGTLLGVMVNFLLKEPPSPQDRAHGLDKVAIVPLPENAAEFAERFGVDVYTNYGLTEASNPIVSGRNPTVAGSAGRIREGITGRLVDENDCEVPTGAAGELVLRSDMAWAMSTGYWRNAEATATLWRNGWLHTGDRFRRDAAGNYFFLDRAKDAIRRRGENISSVEVEGVLLSHPDIREAAAVGVPSAYGEEEVLAVVAPVPGRSVDHATLIAFLTPRMAHYMVPRYLRVLDELPKTESHKVRKNVLRDEGLTADCWDREAAGIVLRAERVGSTAA